MVRVLYLFLLLVVLSPINAFADYQRERLIYNASSWVAWRTKTIYLWFGPAAGVWSG